MLNFLCNYMLATVLTIMFHLRLGFLIDWFNDKLKGVRILIHVDQFLEELTEARREIQTLQQFGGQDPRLLQLDQDIAKMQRRMEPLRNTLGGLGRLLSRFSFFSRPSRIILPPNFPPSNRSPPSPTSSRRC